MRGVALDPEDAWDQPRLFALFSWLSAATTAGMGSKWQPIDVGLRATGWTTAAGVQLDGRGYIRLNDRLETSAPDVWAIGECAGSPQFTHVSEDDFRVIRDNLAGGTGRPAAASFPSVCSRTHNWRGSA